MKWLALIVILLFMVAPNKYTLSGACMLFFVLGAERILLPKRAVQIDRQRWKKKKNIDRYPLVLFTDYIESTAYPIISMLFGTIALFISIYIVFTFIL
jgi:hypothetical protein